MATYSFRVLVLPTLGSHWLEQRVGDDWRPIDTYRSQADAGARVHDAARCIGLRQFAFTRDGETFHVITDKGIKHAYRTAHALPLRDSPQARAEEIARDDSDIAEAIASGEKW